jgi:hypothetical protein
VDGCAYVAERINQPWEFIPTPPFNLTPEEIEAIFPGYPESVRKGLELATVVLVSPDAAANMAKSDDQIGLAVRKFITDEEGAGLFKRIHTLPRSG